MAVDSEVRMLLAQWVEQSPGLALLIDGRGRVHRVSAGAAAALQRRRDELHHCRLSTLLHPHLRQEVEAMLAGMAARSEGRLTAVLLDAHGNPVCVAGTVHRLRPWGEEHTSMPCFLLLLEEKGEGPRGRFAELRRLLGQLREDPSDRGLDRVAQALERLLARRVELTA